MDVGQEVFQSKLTNALVVKEQTIESKYGCVLKENGSFITQSLGASIRSGDICGISNHSVDMRSISVGLLRLLS